MIITHHHSSVSFSTSHRYVETNSIDNLISKMTDEEYAEMMAKCRRFSDEHLENEQYEEDTFNVNTDDN